MTGMLNCRGKCFSVLTAPLPAFGMVGMVNRPMEIFPLNVIPLYYGFYVEL